MAISKRSSSGSREREVDEAMLAVVQRHSVTFTEIARRIRGNITARILRLIPSDNSSGPDDLNNLPAHEAEDARCTLSQLQSLAAAHTGPVVISGLTVDELQTMDAITTQQGSRKQTVLDAVITDALQENELTTDAKTIRRLKKMLLQPTSPLKDL